MLKISTIRAAIAVMLLLFAGACASRDAVRAERREAVAEREPADLVLLHGKIATVDEAMPEAQALAVRGDTIAAVGSDAEIEPLVGPETEVIDLRGKLAIPGFIEGHGHLVSIGRSLVNVNLAGAETWEEVVHRVADRARTLGPGRWVLGRGWHQEKWAHAPQPSIEGYPVHDRLSRVVPDNPVLLTHASGHAALVNARALELAGIDASTPDPPGGRILRHPGGRPTGVLRETAAALVGAPVDPYAEGPGAGSTDSGLEQVIGLAVDECLSKGVTSFQDAGSSFQTVDVLKRMVDEGRLGMRIWVMLGEDNRALEKRIDDYRLIDYGDRRLTVRAIKRAIDGALGSHGAWLLEPYDDQPESTGHNTQPVEELEETARIAAEHGFQLCVHAIGDRANRETLDLFERAFEAHPELNGPRWRVEHAQHLSPADIPRFAGLGVVASMQPIHCTSDGPWVPARIGTKRAEQGAYVWRRLLDSGAVVSSGTDAPVEDVDPIASFHAAVSRRMRDGHRFFEAQRMSREEALRSYTLDAAYAAFEERIKGSLTQGKLADITVLSRDILTVPEEQIPGTTVLYTIVGGQILYRK